MDSFSDSGDMIIKAINAYSHKLSVKPTKTYRNLLGQSVVEEPHFNEANNVIYMDEHEDDYEYAETFKHEVGHFIDAQMGFPSFSDQFDYAIQADLAWYKGDAGTDISVTAEMLTELYNSSAIDNRYLSDILSGLFYDSKRIWTMVEKTYDTLGVAIYGHDELYWKEINGPEKAVEGEVFADLFAIYTENNQETVQFIEKWFPNTANRFKRDLGAEIQNGYKQ